MTDFDWKGPLVQELPIYITETCMKCSSLPRLETMGYQLTSVFFFDTTTFTCWLEAFEALQSLSTALTKKKILLVLMLVLAQFCSPMKQQKVRCNATCFAVFFRLEKNSLSQWPTFKLLGDYIFTRKNLCLNVSGTLGWVSKPCIFQFSQATCMNVWSRLVLVALLE